MSDTALDHYKQGMSLFGQDDYPAAIAAYRQAIEARPDWIEALSALAVALMRNGDLEEAIEVGKQVAELDPEDPFAQTSLSIFYQRKSQAFEEAGDKEKTAEWIELAEKAGAKARLLGWKQELKTNPNAPPPDNIGDMNVIQ